jgi:hypothetical protein
VATTADETLVMPSSGRRGGGATFSTAAVAPRPAAGPPEEEEIAMPPTRSGASRWLTSLNLFLLLLIVVAGVGGAWWFNTDVLKPTSDVVVPNLVGKTLTEAKTMAAEQKFDLAIVDQQYRETEPEGVIYQQGEQPGRTIKAAKAIPIWVSKGPRMAEVPDVRQMTFEKARHVLEQHGLRLGDYRGDYDPIVEKGVVIDQKPPAHEARARGSRIDLVISKGEEPTPTPEPLPTPDTSLPTVDSGGGGTPQPEATPTPEPRTRYFDITYPVPTDGDQHRVRIDVIDDNGPRTAYDEVKSAGTKVKYRVEAVGQQVTIKVYDNDELRSELAK